MWMVHHGRLAERSIALVSKARDLIRFRGSNPLPSAEGAWLDCSVTSIRDLFELNTDSPFLLVLSNDSVTQPVECHLDSMEAAGSSSAGITPHT